MCFNFKFCKPKPRRKQHLIENAVPENITFFETHNKQYEFTFILKLFFIYVRLLYHR